MRSGRVWVVEASGSGPLRARYCWGFHLLFETPRDKHACLLSMQGDLSPSNLPKLVSGKNQGLGVPAPGSGLSFQCLGGSALPLPGSGRTPLGPEAGVGQPPPFLGIRTQVVSLRLSLVLASSVPSAPL